MRFLFFSFLGFFVSLFSIETNIAQPKPTNKELPFVIIIPSYNNESFCVRNFTSAIKQNYKNFRIIYIDDASTDKTPLLIRGLIKKHQAFDKTTYIRNKKNKGAMHNWYHAIHSCKDNEIVVSLDGDDHLLGSDVLSYLNTIYHNKQVWLTYGSFRGVGGRFQDLSRPIRLDILEKRNFRKARFMTSHLRTFYAALFKKIPKKDFCYRGAFFSSATDVAQMIPMLEMARLHSFYIEKKLYGYNRHAGNDDKTKRNKQRFFELLVRGNPALPRLNSL